MKFHLTFCALLLASLPVIAAAQQTFTTPDKAASALVNAITNQNESELNALLGDDWRQYLPSREVDPEAVARFLRDWKVTHRIEQKDDVAHLNVGQDNWQLPIPIIKTQAGWHFDMQKAADEILTRTIGLNELSAIEAAHAYVQAQEDYFQLNAAYAQKFMSAEGKKDGLYWPIKPGEAPSPLGPAFSPTSPALGYHGYHFKILMAQGENAPGGKKSYLADGKLESGFALIAWPVEYGVTGVDSFLVNQDDDVLQKDLGAQTSEKVKNITSYNPDKSWSRVQP